MQWSIYRINLSFIDRKWNVTYMPYGKENEKSSKNKCENIGKCNECKSHVKIGRNLNDVWRVLMRYNWVKLDFKQSEERER